VEKENVIVRISGHVKQENQRDDENEFTILLSAATCSRWFLAQHLSPYVLAIIAYELPVREKI
jgi:hypothetical protein